MSVEPKPVTAVSVPVVVTVATEPIAAMPLCLIDKLVWPMVCLSGFVLLSVAIIGVFAPQGSAVMLIASVFAFAAPTIAALLALFKGMDTGKKVQQLHLEVNSRLTELLDSTATASHAQGKVEGKAEGRLEQKDSGG